MSADNWTDCPRCKAKAEKDYDFKVASVRSSLASQYEKIPAQEYMKKSAEAERSIAKVEFKPDTLREDYELGISQGKFSVSYHGGCEECGFYFDYSHSEPVK